MYFIFPTTGLKSSTLTDAAAPIFPPYEQHSSAALGPRVNTTPSSLVPSNNIPVQPFASLYHRELLPTGPITCREESELQDIVERMTSSFPLDFGSGGVCVCVFVPVTSVSL